MVVCPVTTPDLQFVGLQEHDRVGPVFGVLSTLLIVGAEFTLGVLRAYRSRGKESLRKHILVADDGWPGSVALELGKKVIAWLSSKGQVDGRLSLVELFIFVLGYTSARLSLSLGRRRRGYSCTIGRGRLCLRRLSVRSSRFSGSRFACCIRSRCIGRLCIGRGRRRL